MALGTPLVLKGKISEMREQTWNGPQVAWSLQLSPPSSSWTMRMYVQVVFLILPVLFCYLCKKSLIQFDDWLIKYSTIPGWIWFLTYFISVWTHCPVTVGFLRVLRFPATHTHTRMRYITGLSLGCIGCLICCFFSKFRHKSVAAVIINLRRIQAASTFMSL